MGDQRPAGALRLLQTPGVGEQAGEPVAALHAERVVPAQLQTPLGLGDHLAQQPLGAAVVAAAQQQRGQVVPGPQRARMTAAQHPLAGLQHEAVVLLGLVEAALPRPHPAQAGPDHHHRGRVRREHALDVGQQGLEVGLGLGAPALQAAGPRQPVPGRQHLHVVGAEGGDAPRQQLDEQPLGLVGAAAQSGDPRDVVPHRQRLAVIGPRAPVRSRAAGRTGGAGRLRSGPARRAPRPGALRSRSVARAWDPVQAPLDAHEGAEPPLRLGQLAAQPQRPGEGVLGGERLRRLDAELARARQRVPDQRLAQREQATADQARRDVVGHPQRLGPHGRACLRPEVVEQRVDVRFEPSQAGQFGRSAPAELLGLLPQHAHRPGQHPLVVRVALRAGGLRDEPVHHDALDLLARGVRLLIKPTSSSPASARSHTRSSSAPATAVGSSASASRSGARTSSGMTHCGA